jgi:NitT/TauT family transport system substrate-binding protein
VVRAFTRGLRDTIADPDAAFSISRKMIPEMNDEAATLQRAVLQESIKYWEGDDLGANDPQAWEESVAFLQQVGLLTAEVNPTALYTNQFISKP